MSDGVPPLAEADPRLTMQTIADQQGIIKTLGEIITALKTRIANLEGALNAKTARDCSNTGGSSIQLDNEACTKEARLAQEERIEKLTSEMEALKTERDDLKEKYTDLLAVVRKCTEELQQTHAQCVKLQWADHNYRAARSALCFVESRCREAEQRGHRLEQKVEGTLPERERWKALAISLANRLDETSRKNAMRRISAIDCNGSSQVDMCGQEYGSSSFRNTNGKGAPSSADLDVHELFDLIDGRQWTSVSSSPVTVTVTPQGIGGFALPSPLQGQLQKPSMIRQKQLSVEADHICNVPTLCANPSKKSRLQGNNSRRTQSSQGNRFLAPI